MCKNHPQNLTAQRIYFEFHKSQLWPSKNITLLIETNGLSTANASHSFQVNHTHTHINIRTNKRTNERKFTLTKKVSLEFIKTQKAHFCHTQNQSVQFSHIVKH